MRTNRRFETDVDIVTDYYPDTNSKLGGLLPIVSRIHHTTAATKVGEFGTLRLYERRLEVKMPGVQPPHLAKSKRGLVSLDFDGKARKRMINALNEWRIPMDTKAYFVTLTYPDMWPSDWQSWKADLERFRRVLLDKWPACEGFWKLELQQRGAPHFHLVMTLPKFIVTNRSLYRWVRVQWARIAHKYDQHEGKYATRVDVMEQQSAIYKYISKYVSKSGARPVDNDGVILQDADAHRDGTQGRHWGKIGKPSREKYIEIDMLSISAIDQIKQIAIGWLRGQGAYYADWLENTPSTQSWDCVGLPGLAVLLIIDQTKIGRGLTDHEKNRALVNCMSGAAQARAS